MKILVVHSTEKVGGGEVVSLEIVKTLKNQNELIIFTLSKPAESLKYFLNDQPDIPIVYPKNKNLVSIVKYLIQLIKKEKFDIIHCHGTRSAFWVRLAVIGCKNRPKIIYTLHGFHIIRKPFYLKWPLVLMEKFLNHWTDVLVCVSEADKNLVLKYKTISPRKIVVIKNGIDVEKFNVDREIVKKAREDLGLRNKFVLVSVGRLHSQKDISTILKAMKIIKDKYYNLWQNLFLLIVGDGPLKNKLEKEAKIFKVDSNLRFLGYRNDVPILLNLADVVILSTNWEGLPLVPLEAGACKKPVIVSNVDGIKDTIIDGETGFLFKKGSPEDLAEKILKLFKSEELRNTIGNKAYNFVCKNFTKERMVKEYENLYKSFL